MTRIMLFCCFYYYACCCDNVTIPSCAKETWISQEELLQQLLKNYDRRVPPNANDDNPKPLEVNISVYIMEIHDVNDDKMEYSMSIFFRRMWYDKRLEYTHLTNNTKVMVLGAEIYQQLWQPDIYFVNERRSYFHTNSRPNMKVDIFASGLVYMSTKYTLDLSCPMNMQKFPLDTQQCKLEIEDYSLNTTRLRLNWRAEKPVEFPKRLSLPQFNWVHHNLSDCTNLYTASSYPCLRVVFVIRRLIGYHLISSYIPSGFIVLVSWVSFWIHASSTPARVTLGVTTVLTQTTQSFVTGFTQPQVPYIKAIDVWQSAMMLFVFAALLEYAIVNIQERSHHKRLQKAATEKAHPIGNGSIPSESETNNHIQQAYKRHRAQSETHRRPSIYRFQENSVQLETMMRADKISRVLFPVCYFAFITIYFVFYSVWEPKLPDLNDT